MNCEQNEETNIEVDIHKTKKEYPFNAKGNYILFQINIKYSIYYQYIFDIQLF